MHRIIVTLAGFCVLVSNAARCEAQLQSKFAKDAGVEIAWRGHIQLPRMGRGLASVDVWANASKQEQYAQVKLPNKTFRVAASRLGKDGMPIGLDAAKKMVSDQASRFLGKPTGFQVEELSVPQTYLVAVTRDGLVENFDAETGKLMWSVPCGDSRAPAFPAGLSPRGVAVIHGSRLNKIEWETGKIIASVPTRNKSSRTVGVAADVAFVADYSQTISTYGIAEKLAPWSYVVVGKVTGRPVTFDGGKFTAFSTNRGYTYVFSYEKTPSVWMRYETRSSIENSLAAGNGAIYVGNMGGTLAKVSAESRLGEIVWEYRCSDPIISPALVNGNDIFVATQAGTLVALKDDMPGIAAWRVELDVKDVLAATKDRLFCMSHGNRLQAIDKATGRLVAESRPLDVAYTVFNRITDRLYLIASDGRMECLRPVGGDLPNFVAPIKPVEEEQKPAGARQPASTPAAGGGQNIFGGSAPAADSGDVFNNDIFGAPAGGGGDDPFNTGAGDDPFKTDSGGDPFTSGGSGF